MSNNSRTGIHPPQDDYIELASDTFIKLMRASESVSSRIHASLAALGLTASQFAVLEVLFTKGPLCQREIADRVLRHSSGNTTLVIDNLERLDLVGRERGTRDRRTMMVRLTGDGQKLMSEYLPSHLETIAKEMSMLSEEELRALGDLCRKVGLAEQPQDEAPGKTQ